MLNCGCMVGGIACQTAAGLINQLSVEYANSLRTWDWEKFNKIRGQLDTHFRNETKSTVTR